MNYDEMAMKQLELGHQASSLFTTKVQGYKGLFEEMREISVDVVSRRPRRRGSKMLEDA
jgi:hypothetical protein